MIHYSKKFIEEVKRILPEKMEIHKAIAYGLPNVGSLIYEESKKILDIYHSWTTEMTSHFQQNS
ncbi:MAG: hypothetical protein AB1401_14705 [Thermodesulfobacteriota bacterium]